MGEALASSNGSDCKFHRHQNACIRIVTKSNLGQIYSEILTQEFGICPEGLLSILVDRDYYHLQGLEFSKQQAKEYLQKDIKCLHNLKIKLQQSSRCDRALDQETLIRASFIAYQKSRAKEANEKNDRNCVDFAPEVKETMDFDNYDLENHYSTIKTDIDIDTHVMRENPVDTTRIISTDEHSCANTAQAKIQFQPKKFKCQQNNSDSKSDEISNKCKATCVRMRVAAIIRNYPHELRSLFAHIKSSAIEKSTPATAEMFPTQSPAAVKPINTVKKCRLKLHTLESKRNDTNICHIDIKENEGKHKCMREKSVREQISTRSNTAKQKKSRFKPLRSRNRLRSGVPNKKTGPRIKQNNIKKYNFSTNGCRVKLKKDGGCVRTKRPPTGFDTWFEYLNREI